MSDKFNQLPSATLDPIMLANAEWPAFKETYANPVNTTVGVLVDADTGLTWRPDAVIVARANAVADIDDSGRYGYQSPQGHVDFLANAESFIFGDEDAGDVTAYQTLGGTGALRLTSETLATLQRGSNGGPRELLIDSGWPNHPAIFQDDFRVSTYPHRGSDDKYNHTGALEAIGSQPYDSSVLFQVSGYNDDGLDRTSRQWDEVLELAQEKGMTVILDAAYLGLCSGAVKEDAYPIRKAQEMGLFGFVNVSMSKNMGLYNERLGALFVVNAEQHLGDAQARNLDQTIKRIVRRTVSNPPLLVAEAAARVLEPDTHGAAAYQRELELARYRLHINRKVFADMVDDRVPIVRRGQGLFTKLLADGFSEPQLAVLRQEGILALPNSRINLGGIQHSQIERVGEAVLKALDVRGEA